MIVTPNKITYDGTKIIGDDTEDEDKTHAVVGFENVAFSYPSKPDVQVLNDVSIEVKQNQTVAIVGTSGK
jgi:ABC-type multidrug transport system fused ATPase/permease subunit